MIRSAHPEGLVPLTALQNALRFWWLIFLLMVAGGLVAGLLGRFRPPVYEAVAQFAVGIDYVTTGPMTQFDEDTAFNTVADILSSKTVVQKVVQQANQGGINIRAEDLLRSVTLERKVTVWFIRIRNASPQTADRLASIWAEQGRAALLESYQHALQADALNRYLQSLESCLAQTAVVEPVNVLCSQYRLTEIQSDLRKTGQVYNQERVASHGLFSGMIIGQTDVQDSSEKPVLFGQNQLVLAGALMGLLLGVVLIQLSIPARWLKRN